MKKRPEYDMKIIGANLKRLREKKHLSVEEVREYLGLSSVQAVYKYESGKGYPQADTLLALMELYEAKLEDITKEKVKEHIPYIGIDSETGLYYEEIICNNTVWHQLMLPPDFGEEIGSYNNGVA